MRTALSLLFITTLLACGGGQRAGAPVTDPAPRAAPAVEQEGDASAPSAPPAAAASDVDAGAPVATPPVPLGPAAPVDRTGKAWPFHTWTRAEGVLFNQFPIQAAAQLRAYDEHGWSAHVVDRKPLDDGMASKAVQIVKEHGGEVEVSKCPFPRHAVVLLDGDVPVASINVCFQCGDLLLWPRWSKEPTPDWEKMTSQQISAHHARQMKRVKEYEGVFLPRWQAYFRDDVGFPIDATFR
jgi:hypothetical protein